MEIVSTDQPKFKVGDRMRIPTKKNVFQTSTNEIGELKFSLLMK